MRRARSRRWRPLPTRPEIRLVANYYRVHASSTNRVRGFDSAGGARMRPCTRIHGGFRQVVVGQRSRAVCQPMQGAARSCGCVASPAQGVPVKKATRSVQARSASQSGGRRPVAQAAMVRCRPLAGPDAKPRSEGSRVCLSLNHKDKHLLHFLEMWPIVRRHPTSRVLIIGDMEGHSDEITQTVDQGSSLREVAAPMSGPTGKSSLRAI